MTWPKLTVTAPEWRDLFTTTLVTRAKGGVIKKSIRAFLSSMRRLPVVFPLDVIGDDEIHALLAHMGKPCLKRPVEEVDPDDEAAFAARRVSFKESQRLMTEIKQGKRQKLSGRFMMLSYHRTLCAKLSWKIMHGVQEVVVKCHQVRYALIRRSSSKLFEYF